MKKSLILFAAVALMAMTACNEKSAKDGNDKAAPAVEQVDSSKNAANQPKVDVERAKPTEDGKDHTVAEFNTKEYQMRLENLADGTYRMTLWKAGQDKSGKPEQVIETKQCAMNGDNYLMQDKDGKSYVINAKAGAEELVIMDDKGFIYNGKGVK